MTRLLWRVATWWIRRRLPADVTDPILGDLAEDFSQRQRTQSWFAAGVWLLRESLSITGAYATRPITSSIGLINGVPVLRGLWNDVRFSARLLARHRGFPLAAILTLALGVGANIAVFSAVRTVLLSDLSYPDAASLVSVTLKVSTSPNGDMSPNIATFEALSRQRDVFLHLGASQWVGDLLIATEGIADGISTHKISAGFCDVTGLQPIQGRRFDVQDFTSDTPVALISQSLWISHFGRRPLQGLTMRIAGGMADVVGVMPDGFDIGGRTDQPAQVWLPYRWSEADRSPASGNFSLQVVGRLVPGLSIDEAQSRIAALDGTWPSGPPRNRVEGARLKSLRERYAAYARSGLLLLQGVSLLLLLITCSNLAHLFLAHATTRQRELVVRTALGASGRRLIRLLVAEAALIALAGSLLGVLLATLAVPALTGAASWALPRASEVHVSVIDLAVGLALGSLVVLTFGVVPAWLTARGDQLQTLRAGANATPSRQTRIRRGALVAAQVAFATVLLIAGSLLTRSFHRVTSLPLGFDATGLMVANVQLGPGSQSERRITLRGLENQLRSHFGPGNAAIGGSMPYSDGEIGPGAARTPAGYPDGPRDVAYRSGSPDYFNVLKIPILRGRGFLPSDDAGSEAVAVVNEQFVREFGEGRDLLGTRRRIGVRDVTIVGVAADTRFASAAPPQAAVYWPTFQRSGHAVILRTTNLVAATQELREVARLVDPRIVVIQPELVEVKIALQLAQRRFYFLVVTLLAGLGLALTSLGLWGVVSHLTCRRARESAIRIALGARQGDVTRLVVLQSLAPVVMGLALGVVGAWWAARGLESNTVLQAQLYEMSAQDPVTFVASVFSLLVVAAVACWVPAARASRVDPASVLRAD
jgi:putative ABC transport system permease protein